MIKTETGKAGVAQKVEQLPCKEKVAGSKPAVSTKTIKVIDIGLHPASLSPEYLDEFRRLVEAKKERLAYNAAYQRDLRTIKRLGLEMTVKEWRKTNGN